MSENDKIEQHIAKRFEIIKKIGSGAYGIVWKVLDRKNNKLYALKKNFDAFQNSTDAQRTYREIMFLQKFKHPNIVQIKQIIRSQSLKHIYILFQIMDIDLYTLIRQNMLGEQHKKYIIYQIAKALHYLHTAQLIHRDIKPSNVLVNQDCNAKVCDFGLIRSVGDQFQQQQQFLTEYIATRWYRAPEILLGSKKYSKAADVWSFGCMIGQLIKGKPLFPGNSTLNQIERVITWTGPPNIQDLKSLKTQFGKEMLDILTKIKPISKKEWFNNCSSQAMDLINKTLNFNPQKRPSMLQILKHPYLKEFYSKSQIIESQKRIRIQIDDNKKLSISQYRSLIYKLTEELEEVTAKKAPEHIIYQKQINNTIQNFNKSTVYKNRFGKSIVRSASKTKQQSAPKANPKQGNTVNIKKKYESLLNKNRDEMIRTKYVKTQQIEQKDSIFPKRKKSDQFVKYYGSDKKKKSISGYDVKKDSQILAKYMYQHRKI